MTLRNDTRVLYDCCMTLTSPSAQVEDEELLMQLLALNEQLSQALDTYYKVGSKVVSEVGSKVGSEGRCSTRWCGNPRREWYAVGG